MDFISNISVEIDLQRLMRALGSSDRVAQMIDDAKWATKKQKKEPLKRAGESAAG